MAKSGRRSSPPPPAAKAAPSSPELQAMQVEAQKAAEEMVVDDFVDTYLRERPRTRPVAEPIRLPADPPLAPPPPGPPRPGAREASGVRIAVGAAGPPHRPTVELVAVSEHVGDAVAFEAELADREERITSLEVEVERLRAIAQAKDPVAAGLLELDEPHPAISSDLPPPLWAPAAGGAKPAARAATPRAASPEPPPASPRVETDHDWLAAPGAAKPKPAAPAAVFAPEPEPAPAPAAPARVPPSPEPPIAAQAAPDPVVAAPQAREDPPARLAPSPPIAAVRPPVASSAEVGDDAPSPVRRLGLWAAMGVGCVAIVAGVLVMMGKPPDATPLEDAGSAAATPTPPLPTTAVERVEPAPTAAAPTESAPAATTAAPAPSAAPTAAASADAPPAAAPAGADDLSALLSFQAYVTVTSSAQAEVVVQGQGIGNTNERLLSRCGPRNVRLRKDGAWITPGEHLQITCMQHTKITIEPRP